MIRRAALGVALWAVICGAAAADAGRVVAAQYVQPTTRYAHGVLGDAVEWGALRMRFADGSVRNLVLPQDSVFEDTAPRLADVTGDGRVELVTVESHRDLGARLAIYDGQGLIAATPHIGRRFRWLAPVATGDLDGDGRIELAYIDRPHLAKTLRVWRFADGGLREIASLGGLTNHRIGENFITGGLRTCGARPEMIVVSADWSRIAAVAFENGVLSRRDAGRFSGPASIAAVMGCG